LLKKVISNLELKAYTPNTITSSEWLVNHILKLRAQGYALDEEEYDPQVRCIAAPVRIQGLRQYYALGISGPSSRVAAGRIPVLVRHVLDAASELSHVFGSESEEGRAGSGKGAAKRRSAHR
jgi:DNA-binding IclR family transcriptional regulator